MAAAEEAAEVAHGPMLAGDEWGAVIDAGWRGSGSCSQPIALDESQVDGEAETYNGPGGSSTIAETQPNSEQQEEHRDEGSPSLLRRVQPSPSRSSPPRDSPLRRSPSPLRPPRVLLHVRSSRGHCVSLALHVSKRAHSAPPSPHTLYIIIISRGVAVLADHEAPSGARARSCTPF